MAAKKTASVTAVPTTPTAPTETCFTIMPFGGWFDTYYETVYKPAIEAAGLRACRADDLYRPGTIVNDIWMYTQQAKIVLADLSGKNPNVFYELGLAHALAKPAILVTESMEDVPFDLRALRVLEYDKNRPMWGQKLVEDIASAIKEVLKSPLQAVLPAFLSVSDEAKPRSVSQQEKAFLELRREVDLLRREVAGASRYAPGPGVGPSEARALMTEYFKAGMPLKEAVSRMRRYGVPESFVRDAWNELRGVQSLRLEDVVSSSDAE
jgi:hypothetical protein